MKKEKPATVEENMKKQNTSYILAIFSIIFGCFTAAAFIGLLYTHKTGDNFIGWAIATGIFSVMLITLMSIQGVLDKSVEAGDKKSQRFRPEHYKVNAIKIIAGVLLLIISVVSGYWAGDITTLMAISTVLSISLISEAHHEEVKLNGTSKTDIATYLLFAIMTVLYVAGINALQCEQQTLDVYIISQTLIISAGFTCNTVFFYLKEYLHKGFMDREHTKA